MSTTINMRFCKMHNCSRNECKNKHVITDKNDRKQIEKLFETMYDNKNDAETDIEYRNGLCYYGLLCSNAECWNTHYCNYEFRVKLNTEWKKTIKTEINTTCCQS